jgi:CheY-like chemotaxis protein
LVVHDTDDERALTTLVLTQVGASVAAVPSAREALELLERERPEESYRESHAPSAKQRRGAPGSAGRPSDLVQRLLRDAG